MPGTPGHTEQETKTKQKVLIAGVGNVLLGDDGFGVEVANRLMSHTEIPGWANVIETGIGGMSLIQELMYGYEALIIIDAYARGGTPGQLYFLEPVLPDLSDLAPSQLRDYFADTHYATPMRALSLLAQVAEPPQTLRILGCEPASLDDLKIGMSPDVEIAVGRAVGIVVNLLKNYPEQGLGVIEAQDVTQERQQWSPGAKGK
jgi:hydrogenase maturation protease